MKTAGSGRGREGAFQVESCSQPSSGCLCRTLGLSLAQRGGCSGSPGGVSQQVGAGRRQAKLAPLGTLGGLSVPASPGSGATNHFCSW